MACKLHSSGSNLHRYTAYPNCNLSRSYLSVQAKFGTLQANNYDYCLYYFNGPLLASAGSNHWVFRSLLFSQRDVRRCRKVALMDVL